jgi:hypothetical protein
MVKPYAEGEAGEDLVMAADRLKKIRQGLKLVL